MLVSQLDAEGLDRVDPGDPVRPAQLGRRHVVGELDECLAEEQRHDGQVVAEQPPGRQPDGQPEERRADHHDRQRQPVRQVDAVGAELRRGEQREPVRAEAEERDVAEVEQPGPAHHDVQPHRQQRDHQRVDADLQLETAQAEQRQGQAGQPGDRQPGPPADPLARPLRVPEPGRQVLAPVRLPGHPLVGPDLRPLRIDAHRHVTPSATGPGRAARWAAAASRRSGSRTRSGCCRWRRCSR